MILPGETEAGLCGGRNHAEGLPASRIDAFKIPARRAEYSLTESALSPFQAEPTHGVQPSEWLSKAARRVRRLWRFRGRG
jgi:hypothetical protein